MKQHQEKLDCNFLRRKYKKDMFVVSNIVWRCVLRGKEGWIILWQHKSYNEEKRWKYLMCDVIFAIHFEIATVV